MHCKRLPFDKGVAKKSVTQELAAAELQVRKCQRRAGGIAVRCVVSPLRNPCVMMETRRKTVEHRNNASWFYETKRASGCDDWKQYCDGPATAKSHDVRARLRNSIK